MKNLTQMHCEALTDLECQQIEGGSESQSSSFWYSLPFITGKIIDGFATFSSEGGKNAGLSVR